jgi:hypothetical protein
LSRVFLSSEGHIGWLILETGHLKGAHRLLILFIEHHGQLRLRLIEALQLFLKVKLLKTIQRDLLFVFFFLPVEGQLHKVDFNHRGNNLVLGTDIFMQLGLKCFEILHLLCK